MMGRSEPNMHFLPFSCKYNFVYLAIILKFIAVQTDNIFTTSGSIYNTETCIYNAAPEIMAATRYI
jgi:hypothetical protein